MDVSGYVLGRFSKTEESELPTLLDNVADAIELVVCDGLTAAMNKYNPT
jgi:PTH1 family peptidyl-tRNA hydrolase